MLLNQDETYYLWSIMKEVNRNSLKKMMNENLSETEFYHQKKVADLSQKIMIFSFPLDGIYMDEVPF